MSYEIIQLPAYRLVGLKWEGTYSDIVPNLKNTIQEAKECHKHLTYLTNRTIQLGLSYHTVENGFVHYSGFEVDHQQVVPEGMIAFEVPAFTYVKTIHKKEDKVEQTYIYLHKWFLNSTYKPYLEEGVKYYDPALPIKHEYYPLGYEEDKPEFDIYVPVVKK